jgi:predicted transcriptional regulator
MNVETSLKDLGLLQSEIRIYLYLLQQGLATPPQISKGTGIQRTNAYHVLQSLREKGLILEQTKGTRKVYLTNDPEALLLSLERKKDIVANILPDLRGLRNVQKNKPTIRFFDGITQIQEIYWLSLEAKEIIALGSTNRLYALFPEFMGRWVQEVKKRQIIIRDIVTFPSRDQVLRYMSEALKGSYDARILPMKYGELSTDLLLWNDNIALITLEEPYFGTILTNAQLTKTFKIMLELIRERL